MNIKCPHCGTEYEVEQKDMYRYAQCEVCGKGFVIGTTTNSTTSGTSRVSGSSKVPQTHKKSSTWSFDKSHSHGAKIPHKFVYNKAPRPLSESSSKKPSNLAKIAWCFSALGVVLVIALVAIKYHNESVIKEIRSNNLRKVELYKSAMTTLEHFGLDQKLLAETPERRRIFLDVLVEKGVLSSLEKSVVLKAFDLEERAERASRRQMMGYDLSAQDLKAMGAWQRWKAALDPEGWGRLHRAIQKQTGTTNAESPLLPD